MCASEKYQVELQLSRLQEGKADVPLHRDPGACRACPLTLGPCSSASSGRGAPSQILIGRTTGAIWGWWGMDLWKLVAVDHALTPVGSNVKPGTDSHHAQYQKIC